MRGAAVHGDDERAALIERGGHVERLAASGRHGLARKVRLDRREQRAIVRGTHEHDPQAVAQQAIHDLRPVLVWPALERRTGAGMDADDGATLEPVARPQIDGGSPGWFSHSEHRRVAQIGVRGAAGLECKTRHAQ